MAPEHSHPYPPSPTPYTNASTTAARSNIRCNLFSTHLSRRPASSQQSSQATETFIPPLSPTRSPSRSPEHSPTYTRSNTSSDAIIATHPNGRPLLPNLPRLPAHLRLSTTSDDDTQPYNLDDTGNQSPTRYNHPNLEAEDHEDRARIEKGLVEMMWRQRQRGSLGPGGGSPQATRNGGEERSREEEELLGLIMERLREKVAVLESEGWTYGERMDGAEAQV